MWEEVWVARCLPRQKFLQSYDCWGSSLGKSLIPLLALGKLYPSRPSLSNTQLIAAFWVEFNAILLFNLHLYSFSFLLLSSMLSPSGLEDSFRTLFQDFSHFSLLYCDFEEKGRVLNHSTQARLSSLVCVSLLVLPDFQKNKKVALVTAKATHDAKQHHRLLVQSFQIIMSIFCWCKVTVWKIFLLLISVLFIFWEQKEIKCYLPYNHEMT